MATVPVGWTFESRHDVGRHCAHDPYDVRVIGNQPRRMVWRCMACLNEVVPVGPGWAWDRRRQEHVHPQSRAATARGGHAARYMLHEPPEGWAVNADLIRRPSPADLEEWLREPDPYGHVPVRVG